MENAVEVSSGGNGWDNVLGTVLKIPGVRVDRRAFLAREFAKYCDDDQVKALLENGTARAGIPVDVLDKVAGGVIGFHGTLAVGISFVSGLPGGLAMLGTVPADLAQYFFHALQVSQKLAYVYGYPDFDEVDDNFKMMMTIFIGVMLGVGAASGALTTVSKMFAQTAVKRLSAAALTKGTIYPVVKAVARTLGIRMTKQIFARAVGKAIPLIGGVISGGLTAAIFLPSANKLKDKLRTNMASLASVRR